MSDEQIERDLRDALTAEVPARRGPSANAIAALRAAAEAQRDAAETLRPVAPRAETLRAEAPRATAVTRHSPTVTASGNRWPRGLLVAAAVLVAFVCGAVLTSDPPGVVRDVAHGIGLDVESSDMVEAREQMDALGSALAVATGSKVEDRLTEAQLEAVALADRDMLRAVAKLDEGERKAFVPTAHQVHLRAVALFVAEGRDLATAQPRDLEELRAGS